MTWGSVVVAGAMGVRRDFYAPFAQFLGDAGLRVHALDYRGMGAERPASLRGFEADVRTWAEGDLDPLLVAAKRQAPAQPLFFVGHSLGGQLLGVLPHRHLVDAAVTVTAGSGYYRLNDRMPLQVRFLWFVAMPLLTRLFGYFPGKRLRMVGDLPAGVAWQWRRWCLHPDYLLSEGAAWREAYATLAKPILSWSFEDDPLVPGAAIDDLHRRYAAAAVERRHVAPAELGERAIGHFGFFHPRSRASLWDPTVAWLRRHATTTEATWQAATVP